MHQGEWMGAAGVVLPLDQDAVSTLAGLTAADMIVTDEAGASLASSLEEPLARELARAAGDQAADSVVRTLEAGGRDWWVVAAPLGDVAQAVFVQDVARELAVLPGLRRGALAAGGLALLLSMLLGGIVAARLVHPVASLARAADRLAEGDFETPLPPPRPLEVARVTRAFDHMRQALGARVAELRSSNLELARREERLQTLQSEMIQRDRLTAAGRLVTELAHEIRNPVANVRNCLEVIRRRTEEQPELRRFADLAIDELLRMHELAEQMLELNRPMDPGASRCDPTEVAHRVAALLRAGDAGIRWPTTVAGAVGSVPLSPDVLKQVLLSLAQNARESMPEGGRVEIRLAERRGEVVLDVLDEGPGIPDDVLPRVFDPFFTTKGDARGVGLGLFIAEGLVRRGGGRLLATNRSHESGACLRIILPAGARAQAGDAELRGESAPTGGGTA
jgi:signal transduction histidine kinase